MNKSQTYFSLHAKEILKEKGFTQALFADAMGVARQNVAKVVFNSNNIQVLAKAADVLGVSLSFLIGIEKEEEIKVNGFIEVDGTIHRITSKQQLIELAYQIEGDEDSSKIAKRDLAFYAKRKDILASS